MNTMRHLLCAALAVALLLATLVAVGAASASAGGMAPEGKTGDLNMDGMANSLDALLILFYDAGLSEPPVNVDAWTLAADVDCDLDVTALDAQIILQADAGMYKLRT